MDGQMHQMARRLHYGIPLAVLMLLVTLLAPVPAARAVVVCDIACENAKPGTPQSVWDISGAGDATIQGFSTDISYNVGATAQFKINTTAPAYSVDVYRLGWYGGNGARKVASITPSATLPQTQPACASDPSVGLYDCGPWGVSASWPIPADAVSGIYIANLTRADTGGSSHITFVVRNDASRSVVVFQTSDQTWQAYNDYGGASFYRDGSGLFTGTGPSRALKLSYNRPFATRGPSGRDFLFSNEFPMLQFLERNGYDVSYQSGLDTSRNGALLLNHRTFLSVGHDEYWSGAQRANVEAARDAGVNLAFFSGNEVYWRTRWEPSIDGNAQSNRTLVSYKETLSNAKVDPAPEWTGTWRDPRFATKAQGADLPENALTGTIYKSNFTDLPITVQQDEGKFRLWRSTELSTMTAASTPLALHTIGYESDEDLDNGSRPLGLVRLSTTTGSTPQYLLDYGNTVAPGTTTHHLTMYKAPSGALVFGAGTVQWAWGLSQNHDGDGAPADPRMQQATINLLADMSAQPSTLMAGMSPASASLDTTAPTTTITAPTAGASIPNGTAVTVTGTAADVGGRVAGVEASTDGGTTWHPADGRTSWRYTYTQTGNGAETIRVRAIDDSANIGLPATTTVAASCPCSLFGATVPTVTATADASAVELGVRFQPAKDGYVNAVRFYKGAGNTGTHVGSVWSSTGVLLATGTFADETASGWQTLELPTPIAVATGTTYVVSYYAPAGKYAADANFFTTGDHVAAPLKAPGKPTGNGVYRRGAGFPSLSYANTNYWVDVLFTTVDTSPPVVSTKQPIDGASSVSPTVRPTAVFASTINASSLTFSLADDGGVAVTGTTTYDQNARTATFTAANELTRGARYTASVRATSAAGVPMAQALSWSFKVAEPTPAPGVCPCSVWDDLATPTTVTSTDAGNVELGVKFTAETDGAVTGVRFYKGPKNTGTHTGSLWSATGTLLGTATFTGETTSGWQKVAFSSPVPVFAGATYTASYRAPRGFYSADKGAFSTTGKDSPPLRIPQGGAVYTYGTSAPTTASMTNYWVDVVYVYGDGAPTVASTSPSAGATSVSTRTSVTGTFAGGVQSGTARISVTGPAGNLVVGTTSYSSTARAITFTPSGALVLGGTYSATVSDAKAMSGATMTPYTWTFTTAGGACPCTLFGSGATPLLADAGDAKSIEVGVKFVPGADGRITGMRFYKSLANTGTHVGTLWTSAGARLGSVTFTGESASGWQVAMFATPVDVTAGTTYVVSYLAPVGRYSASSGFFTTAWSNGVLSAPAVVNGVYLYGAGGFPTTSFKSTNYWVDPLFVTR